MKKTIPTEMGKLFCMLAENEIPFTVRQTFSGSIQFVYPCDADLCWRIDAISTPYTMGGQEGLIEIMFHQGAGSGEVEGYLTAEDAYRYILEDYEEQSADWKNHYSVYA